MTRSFIVAVLALAALTAACGAPAAYQLRGPWLVPPQTATVPKTLVLRLRLANVGGCDARAAAFSAPELGLQWTLADRRLTVAVAPAVGRFTGSVPHRLYVGLQQLHTALDGAVAEGCLTPFASERFLRRAAESMPMASDVAQSLILGPYAAQQYMDVTGPVRLVLAYGLRADQPERYDLGYVEREYRFERTDASGRGALREVSARVLAAPRPRALPPSPVAMTQPGARFFRFFFLLRLTERDHDIALVSATNRPALDDATRQILAHPRDCAAIRGPAPANVTCILVSPPMNLEARVTVSVNGRDVAVPLPATVGDALRAARAGDRDVAVWRPYHGRERRVVPTPGSDLFALALAGGERITCK